jgi:hypothetical protein
LHSWTANVISAAAAKAGGGKLRQARGSAPDSPHAAGTAQFLASWELAAANKSVRTAAQSSSEDICQDKGVALAPGTAALAAGIAALVAVGASEELVAEGVVFSPPSSVFDCY